MPKPLSSQPIAHSRVCASASAAALFEQATSTTETLLKVCVAASAGAAIKPSARREASIFIVIVSVSLLTARIVPRHSTVNLACEEQFCSLLFSGDPVRQ